MKVFVDVQGFKSEKNSFILKELAVLYDDKVQVFLIKPPCAYSDLTAMEKKHVTWIERNRKISWREGIVPYEYHTSYFLSFFKNKEIYCKGLEKVLWLKNILDNNNIYNVEEYGCPNLLNLYKEYNLCSDIYSCIYHPTICALKNVMCIKKWCVLNNKVFNN